MPSLWHSIRRAPSKVRKLYFAERAERYEDAAGISHILIVEASGRGAARHEPALAASRDEYLRDTGVR